MLDLLPHMLQATKRKKSISALITFRFSSLRDIQQKKWKKREIKFVAKERNEKRRLTKILRVHVSVSVCVSVFVCLCVCVCVCVFVCESVCVLTTDAVIIAKVSVTTIYQNQRLTRPRL